MDNKLALEDLFELIGAPAFGLRGILSEGFNVSGLRVDVLCVLFFET